MCCTDRTAFAWQQSQELRKAEYSAEHTPVPIAGEVHATELVCEQVSLTDNEESLGRHDAHHLQQARQLEECNRRMKRRLADMSKTAEEYREEISALDDSINGLVAKNDALCREITLMESTAGQPT